MRHPIASIMARRFGWLKASPLWGEWGGATGAASHFPAALRFAAAPSRMTEVPLWPAGHLPHKWGENMRHPIASIMARRFGWLKPSPLWGGWGGATGAASHFPAGPRFAAAPSRMTEIPLWPAGHLPHKGGENMRHLIASIMARRFGRVKPSLLWGGWGGVTGADAASHFPAALHPAAAPSRMTTIPLWPAGHLPHKGGEDMRHPIASIMARRFGWLKPSPLWGGWGGATGADAASHFPAALHPAAAPSRMTTIPLWPAGHLPHKGGEDMRHPIASIMARRFGWLKPSPLWGGWGGVTGAGMVDLGECVP
jgi:hypothetical protein